jgi:hypothetical protein
MVRVKNMFATIRRDPQEMRLTIRSSIPRASITSERHSFAANVTALT